MFKAQKAPTSKEICLCKKQKIGEHFPAVLLINRSCYVSAFVINLTLNLYPISGFCFFCFLFLLHFPLPSLCRIPFTWGCLVNLIKKSPITSHVHKYTPPPPNDIKICKKFLLCWSKMVVVVLLWRNISKTYREKKDIESCFTYFNSSPLWLPLPIPPPTLHSNPTLTCKTYIYLVRRQVHGWNIAIRRKTQDIQSIKQKKWCKFTNINKNLFR